MESGAFKILNASIILPSLLFLLEVLFKIGAKRKEEHEERQWECIEKTSEVWNQLFSLASEVRYFKKDDNKGARIEDILLKLAKFIGPAEDVVSMWNFRFFRNIPEKDIGYSKEDFEKTPKTSENATKVYNIEESVTRGKSKYSKEDIESSFLVPINVLLRSTLTVAYFIRDANKEAEKEIPWLQSSLEQIQAGIQRMAHHSIIGVLEHSMYLEESGKEAIEGIQKDLDKLRKNADWLTDMEKKNNKLFPSVEGNEVEDFRKAVKKMWYEEAGKESGNLKDLFLKIPSKERPRLMDVWFSTDYVKHLADEITYKVYFE